MDAIAGDALEGRVGKGGDMHRIIISLALALVVAGCGDPLKSVPKLSDVELAADAGQADALAAPIDTAVNEALIEPTPAPVAAQNKPRKGLMGFLGRKAEEAKRTAAAQEPVPETLQETGQEPVADAGVSVVAQVGPEPMAANATALEGQAAQTAPTAERAEQDSDAPVVLAALPAAQAAPKPKKKRLFGLGGGSGADRPTSRKPKKTKGPKPGDPDFEIVSLETPVPYGSIARVCGARPAQMGQKVGQWPERGSAYTLYDSAPGGTAQRSFYLTGFGDGCARKFSAALVLFASPDSYEAIHYGPAGSTLPVAKTDSAYEKVKSRVCRVAKGKPCGDKMKKLARDTVFVTVYERFGGNPRWKNFLLHDGKVEAMDLKSAG
ncbi:MAG: hypothetical protein ACRBB0_23135 [Pelagimonas sp.]|uniref:hypothetical protein n=1 Tax=Pelagimonas sp. TaxID=2073170 RepID=UPI003D6C143C